MAGFNIFFRWQSFMIPTLESFASVTSNTHEHFVSLHHQAKPLTMSSPMPSIQLPISVCLRLPAPQIVETLHTVPARLALLDQP